MATAKKVPYFKPQDLNMYNRLMSNLMIIKERCSDVYMIKSKAPKTVEIYDDIANFCDKIISHANYNIQFLQILYMNKKLHEPKSRKEYKMQRRYLNLMKDHEFLIEQFKQYKKSILEKRKRLLQKAQVEILGNNS